MNSIVKNASSLQCSPLYEIVNKYLDFRGKTPLKIGMEWGGGDILALSANNVVMGKIDKSKEAYFGSGSLYKKWMNKGDCESGDILLTMEAPLGNVAQIPDDKKYILSQRVILIKIKRGIVSPDFLFHLFMGDDFQRELIKNSTGSTVTGIQQKKLDKIEVCYPSLKEQQKIAKILTTVDNLIEKTEALIEKYQAIKQGMMHDLFTRGIDTNDQLRPSHHDAPHLYKQTELGWLPKEWGARRLGDVAVKIQDGTHFSPQTTEGEYLYLTSKNIRFGYLDLENIEKISEAEHNSIYTRCDVRYGDLLLTKDGANTGNAALNTIKEPFSMLSSVAFIRLDGVSAHADFLLHYLLSLDGQKRMKDQMSGNAITRLTLTIINDFLVLQPPGSEQRLIADRLNSIKIKIESEESYAQKLMANKKGLMQDLLTGKVRVN